MTQAVALATAASDQDPRVGLRAAAGLRKLVDQLEDAQVRRARALGWSWAEVARELGVTRQAAYKKHGRR
jgi:DNA invertase Pin-like site-specific DNA recombinase